MTTYQMIMIAFAILAQTVGALMWVSKVKNDLNTRVAVLEASYNNVTEDLKEIKSDVKELLRSIAS